MWNGEPPSGREHAIETLLDSEPYASRVRTGRVLEEVVPLALSHRPNLVTRSALIEEAYGLAKYEIDNVQQYDDAFGGPPSGEDGGGGIGGGNNIVANSNSGSKSTPTTPAMSSSSTKKLFSSASPSSLSSSHFENDISDVQRNRILRHHKKILAAKKPASGLVSSNNNDGESGSSYKNNSGGGGGSATPVPQLVTALRRIYDARAEKKDGNNSVDKDGSDNVSSGVSSSPVLKTLLESVLGHPAFSKEVSESTTAASLAHTSSTSTGTGPATLVTTDDGGDATDIKPTQGCDPKVEVKTSSPDVDQGTNLNSETEEFSFAVETLIGELCDQSTNSTKLDSTDLEHGLLIAALSILTGYGTNDSGGFDDYFVTNTTVEKLSSQNDEASSSGKMIGDVDDPKVAPPLQVGSILSLLQTENSISSKTTPFQLDSNAVSYLGKAASIYEERIEIQKARLMKRLEGIDLENDGIRIEDNDQDPAFATPVADTLQQSPSGSSPVVATPNPSGTPLDGSSTPDAIGTEAYRQSGMDRGPDAALSAAAVLENILAAAVEEGLSSADDPMGERDNADSASNSDSEINEDEILEDAQEVDIDNLGNRLGFHHLIDEDEDDDSSSSSSDSMSDDAPEEEGRDAIDDDLDEVDEDSGDDGGDDLVLRQALALSLVEPGAVSSSSSRGDEERLTSPGPEENPSSPVTPGNATPVSTSESAPSKEEESPLPPIPPPPRQYPLLSSLNLNKANVDDDNEVDDDGFYFDPAALSRFGVIDADIVLVHLLRCLNEKIQSRRFYSSNYGQTSSSEECFGSEPPPGGIGSSLFQCTSASETRPGRPDTASVAVYLQLLSALFLVAAEKREYSFHNFQRALDLQKQTDTEGSGNQRLSSGEEGDDPAIAMALTYFDEESSESKDTLEAKGMHRKAAAAARDAAALLESRRKKVNAWKEQMRLFSYACLLSIKSLKYLLQTITKNWVSNRPGLSVSECSAFFPPGTVVALSSCLDVLASEHFSAGRSSILEEDDTKGESGPMPLNLYQEVVALWGEMVPILYPSSQDQLAKLSLFLTDKTLLTTQKVRSVENLTALPASEGESLVHRLHALCRRLRLCDLLDGIVPRPLCYVPEGDMKAGGLAFDESCSKGSMVVDMLMNSPVPPCALKGEPQRLCLSVCHRCHTRILMWDGFLASAEAPEESPVAAAPLSTGTDLRSMKPSSDLMFDSTKCADSMAIIAGKDKSASSTVPACSVHQRASKVWGTVLSSMSFSPQTGVHRFALRLDKCERGHVFVGVATAQASVRTYVGGDKYGWGAIGTQALWHDRRKLRSDYGATFRTGSVIIVTLDTDAGTLSFSCWKETSNGSPLSLDQGLHSPSNRREAGGIVEDWGVAFEGLPLDAKLFPAVGLYQRDDKVTLLAVETSSNDIGPDGLYDFSGGLGYFPIESVSSDLEDTMSTKQRYMSEVCRFNNDLQVDGMKYVKSILTRTLDSVREGENGMILTEVFPSLASSLCLSPEAIPILSRRLGLALLPVLSKTILDIDDAVPVDAPPLFHCKLQPGKWTVRATGSNSDVEEYMVDFSTISEEKKSIGFKGSGVGTTGKSKNGLVAIFGTTSGSSLSFVEEWASEDGFESPSGEMAASSCVVSGRISLDGCSFEGTYRNVQYGTTGQIAGRILSTSNLVSKSSLLRLQDAQSSSTDEPTSISTVVTGQSLLCLAHSHLSWVICEDGVDERLYDAARQGTSDESKTIDTVELKSCLQLPIFELSSKSTTQGELTLILERMRSVYFDDSRIHTTGDLSAFILDSALQDSFLVGIDTRQDDTVALTGSIIRETEELDCKLTGRNSRTGSLVSLCPSEYNRAKQFVFCALSRHCGMQIAELDTSVELSLWKSSLKLLEDGIRRALSKDVDRSMREKATDCCKVFCDISSFLLEFEFPTTGARNIESVVQDFSQVYKSVHNRADIDFLHKELSRLSEKALFRLLSIQSLQSLLDSSSDRHVQNFSSIESLASGLPRLLGRGYGSPRRGDRIVKNLGPHYLARLSGTPSILRESIASVVQSLYRTISQTIESGLLQRENDVGTASVDSMILTLSTTFVTDYQKPDIDAMVNQSGILSFVPKLLRHYESSLKPIQKEEMSDNSVVQDIHILSQNEVSRGILRVVTSLVQVLCYSTWTVDSGNLTSKTCVDMLAGEIENIFSLATKSVEDFASRNFFKQMDWQWETFQDNWIKEKELPTERMSKRIGGAGIEYLQQRGLVQTVASPASPKKSSQKKLSQSVSPRRKSDISQSVFHQYMSQWLNIVIMASNTDASSKLLGKDRQWIALLFSAVGICVDSSSDKSSPFIVDLETSESRSLLPSRYRCRVLRSLRGPLQHIEPSSDLVRAIVSVAGSSCGVMNLSPDDEENCVSREAVSLLRSLHTLVHDEWRSCITSTIASILQDVNSTVDEIHGIMCFFNGSIDALKNGSFVLLKPAAAVPLSPESNSLSSSKASSAAASIGSSAPHHVVGNGTEGVISGLCRSEASAGIVSNIDMKTSMCEVVLLNRNGTETAEEQRNVLTIRALRSALTSVVQAQEVPLLIDDAFPTFAHHMLSKYLHVLHDSRFGPVGVDGQMEDVHTVHSKTRAVCAAAMAVRASISLLSDEKSIVAFAEQPESRTLLASVLQLAYPNDCSTAAKSDLLKNASTERLSSIPVHGTRLVHVMSLFRKLCSEETVLDKTPSSVWGSRLQDLENTKETNPPEEVDTSKNSREGRNLSTPAPRGVQEGTSSGRTESAATARTTSQSTAASDNNDESDENEAAAAAAHHLREVAIEQMAELGLPRAWSELALRRVGGTNIEAAVHFCLERGGDMERLLAEERERDRQSPGARRRIARAETNHLIQSLTDMGFPRRWASEALAATGNNVDEALTWILTNGERLSAEDEGMEDDANEEEGVDNEEEDEEEDDEDESLDEEEEQDITPDKITADAERNDESLPQPVGWSGSIMPLRFISGKSIIDANTLEISGLPSGGFSSVGTKGVMLCTGKWYYECTLETAGCLQVGFADGAFAGQANSDRGDGCGDGPSSWAFDGWRRYRWHSQATEWGCRWSEGDVIGCMVDMDERKVSFTLNGKGEEIGMGVAFSGHGFRPCSGVYACVSFNRREKLKLNLGGDGSAPWKYPPPEGYKGVGEAVLDAVQERKTLLSKEAILDEKQEVENMPKRYLCDFSDGEHGFELMSHSHRYYGSDASVHLGSGRMKQSTSTSSKSASTLHSLDSIASLCLTRRIAEEWKKSKEPSFKKREGTDGFDTDSIKSQIIKEMNVGLQSVAVKLCIQGAGESLVLSSLLARKLLLHIMVATEDRFDPSFVLDIGENERSSALCFWRMIEASTNLSSAGWVGEASSMAVAAESLGLGISSTDASSRLSSDDRSGFASLEDLDQGIGLPTAGLDQILSCVLDPSVDEMGLHLGNSLASGAEFAIGSDAGQGILVFLQKSLRSAVSKSDIFKTIIVAAVRRFVRQLAVVEYDSEDSTRADSTADSDGDTKRSTKDEARSEKDDKLQPDARLASFFSGLLITCENDVHESLFEAWSVGMLSASVPWRMICAFTAAGILEQRPEIFPTVMKLPTLCRFYSRLRDIVARRVWAERAASPVASRYIQAILQLLCSVNHAVNIAGKDSLPKAFVLRWNHVEVDAATPLPLFQSHESKSEAGWEVGEGWVSSDSGWELWTGTITRESVNWKAPPPSAVRSLMEGGEGPPMLREGCTVMRGPDWDFESYGNADGKDMYEAEKVKREQEKKKTDSNESVEKPPTKSNTGCENKDPTPPANENEDQGDGVDPAVDQPISQESEPAVTNENTPDEPGQNRVESEDLVEIVDQTIEEPTPPEHDPEAEPMSPEEDTADDALENPAEDAVIDPESDALGEEGTNNSTEDSTKKLKKKKLPNPKLPIGVVIGIEAWEDIPAMAYRVRWVLTGEEGVYRFGAGSRFDISHVDVNAKMTRVRKRHPLPESAEQCVARHGFGVTKTSTIIIRLSQTAKEETDDNGIIVVRRKGIMEYPEFGAGISIDCKTTPDGSVWLEEKDLLFGSNDSGWEARFGSPSYISGTTVVLKTSTVSDTQNEVDTKSPYDSLYEKLSGSTSHRVPRLRNRENGGEVDIKSTFQVVRGRSTSSQNEPQDVPKHIVEAPTPGMQFDKTFHASSLSVSRDGTTMSCVSSDGRGTAFANVGFSKGVHYWEVKLESCDIGSVFIGVAEKPSAGTSGASVTSGNPPRLNRWHGFGFVNFRATYTSGAERIYGAHCHAGDTIGVLLDCDGGRISFFYDGMKYGEHILNDLGVAFENLSPFGFNCDGCGSGGAGQGAPSANEQGGRGMRYPSGAVRPKTLWPVVGLRNQGDRVSFSQKVHSSYGIDGVTTLNNILATDEILRAYDGGVDAALPNWFLEEAFDEYHRWRSNSWSRGTPRGRGPYPLTTTTFGSDLDLDPSHFACASACALLGMKHALLAGDRVKLKRSAGRMLELAEEAVILGSFQGRLYYSIVSQQSEGGSLREGGGRAWCFDESEVVNGLEIIGTPRGLNADMPLMDRFTCTSTGGLRIVYEGGAVIRSDIEIFDGSFSLGSIPFDTVIPKQDVLERRVNSSGVVRYLVRYDTFEGWISARIRGGNEEQILVPVEAEKETEPTGETKDGDGDNNQQTASISPSSYPTPALCAQQWLENFAREQRLRGKEGIATEPCPSTDVKSIDDFASLAAKGIVSGCTGAEMDVLIGRSLSKICDFCDGGDPLNAPFDQVQSAFTFAFNLLDSGTRADQSTKLIDGNFYSISPQGKEAAATALSSWTKFPSVESVMARVAILRAFNRRIRVALPWMAIRPCQEGSGILGGLYGHGSSIDRAGRSSKKVLRSQWVQVPSTGTTLRKPSINGLIFTSVKKEYLQSVTEVTTTPTPLAHDEYELPREIRTVRINRIRARNIMKSQRTDDSSLIALKRKYSVFSQLQHETRNWGGAGLRRGFVAKGHGGQKRAFKVKLIGEGCNDYSGPYREIFTDSLSEITNTSSDGRNIFGTLGVLDPTPNNVSAVGENRDLFMFSLNGSDVSACLPPHSSSLSPSENLIRSSFASLIASRGEPAREVEEALVFLGRLVGTALRHGIALDLPLPLDTVWKKIVEQEVGDEVDLKELDLLSWRNGASDRYSRMKPALLLWQDRMLNFFVEGLSNVLPIEVFSILSGEELRDMICGNPEIDVDLLRRVVEYEGYKETDEVIQFFWEALREFTNEERKKFLQFVWARNRLPIKESDFDAPFKIQKDTGGSEESQEDQPGPVSLPSASTCFFALTLPAYKTKEELKEKLLFAINNVATMETDFSTQSHEIAEGYRSF
mmetsp:Transcript_36487/g.88057  ORF Transcript_36487/g.88057 Transcript_36487/m.88057 type:complete len:5319 (+) Transcript_36487:189-16145(+)